MDDLVGRMRADLAVAMRARDRLTTSVLRNALSAVANAEAVPVGDSVPGDGPIAGAVGVGAAEAPRKELTAADIIAVVRAERDEQLAAATQLDASGTDSRGAADQLRAGAAVLDRYL